MTLTVLHRVAAPLTLDALGGDAGMPGWAIFGIGHGPFGATAPFIAPLAAEPLPHVLALRGFGPIESDAGRGRRRPIGA